MRKPLFASLRVKLFLLVLIALVPAVGLSLYRALEERRLSSVTVQATALRLARLASSEQGRLITGTRQLLVGLAHIPAVRAPDSRRCSALFADLLAQHPLYANLGAIDSAGRLFCSALPVSSAIDLADRAYFRRALATRDFAIGDFQIGRVTGKATVNVAYPILQGPAGPAQGVVFAAIDLAWLNQFIQDAQLPAGSTFTVIDQQGTILVRHPEPEKWVGRSARHTGWVRAILEQRAGVAEALELDGVERLVGFSPLLDRQGGDVYVSVGISKAAAFAEANQELSRSLATIAVVGLLALLAARWCANRFILAPVGDLVRATRRIAAGDLGARTSLGRGAGELGQLSRAFDEMAESLERNTAQLVKSAKLAELGRLAAGVGHELRNPLSVLDGRLQLLERHAASNDVTSRGVLVKNLRPLKDAAERMKGIVQGLSTYSKPSRPEPVRLDVSELLTAVRELVAYQAKIARVSITVDAPSALPTVLGDRSQLVQVLVNLAVNGIEAMAEGGGGQLMLGAGVEKQPRPSPDAQDREPNGPRVAIEVRDTGPGIPPDRQARIWEPFYTTKAEGTGLGLSLVRALVEQQPGATISLESTPGAGTTFRIAMPAAPGG